MSESDKALAERATGGDKGAFAELVRRHVRGVTAFTLAVIGRREDARDIAQEAFIEAYAHMGELRDPGRFRSWVFGIAQRKAIYLLRQRGRKPEAPIDLASAEAAEGDPAQHAEEVERREILVAAVAELPKTMREAILLTYVGEMSQKEIADALSITEDAVQKRLSRAKEALRVQLKGLL